MMDWSKYTITRCNDEQTLRSRSFHLEKWGVRSHGYTPEQYYRKFEVMDEEEWAVNDGIVHWALVPRSETSTLDLLSHVETWRRKSLIKRPGQTAPEEVVSYGIAYVYTPEKHQGHGYGRHLLQLLHYILAPLPTLPSFPTTWGDQPSLEGFNDAAFSFLFSGVGDKFYASCRRGEGDDSLVGWVPIPLTNRHWDLSKVAQEAQETHEADQTGWKWLTVEDLTAVEEEAIEDMKLELGKDTSDRIQLAISPEQGCFRQHALRNTLTPSGIANPSPPRHYGLSLPPDPHTNKRPYIIYTFPESATETQALRICYISHPFPWSAVVAAAKKENCTLIRCWGPRAGWDDHGAELKPSGGVPGLAVYGHNEEECDWRWLEL
ncbi:hypothetical protein BD324DRAFT_623842 [Kockovaella imperatae]|uniref:N-acetyltransferase domain-containing protein n=1 Tax=Kockovaella imperatae TaxID=4999 RepID=A0A1Y1UIN6_9TREE|nr:hypothetical protein BD324DRAFT_623842 [Kockovaella imperatae]ORX37923.1 hypothetical protein BD324DRAFT_623842 [Kockovaella imperatae]